MVDDSTRHLLSQDLTANQDSSPYLDNYPLEKKSMCFRLFFVRLFRGLFNWLSFYKFSTYPRGIYVVTTSPVRKRRTLFFPLKLAGVAVLFLVVLSISDALLFPSYTSPPDHYGIIKRAVAASAGSGRGNPRSQRIFIASNIINANLIRGHWGDSLIQLIEYLGPKNVFLSIYENDSGQDTAASLREFAQRLHCRHSVVAGDRLALAEFPSIITSEGEARVKRLTYLQEVRNRLLWPLDHPSAHPGSVVNFTSIKFDRILFINDVYFDPVEALQLLFATNLNPTSGAPDYQAACAADFINPVLFYDTFVLRDSKGYGAGVQFFPWFSTSGGAESRKAVLAECDAIPVKSCWSGMVAYDANQFLRPAVFSAGYSDTVPPAVRKHGPLRFRHQPEIYWEESECCLINADLAARTNPEQPKIFLNPYIRVAYDAETWSWLPFMRRIERVFSILQYCVSTVGYPEYNPRRREKPGMTSTQMRWVYDEADLNGEKHHDLDAVVPQGRLKGSWQPLEGNAQPGGFCGQRRLFLMMKDFEGANRRQGGRNWEKKLLPRGK